MFYAYYNRYGNGTRYAGDGRRIGHLRIFATKSERNAWVDSDKWDGSYHREAMTYREALPYLVDAAAMYSGEYPAECRARGAGWMCDVIAKAESDGYETARKYGIDW